MRRIIVFVFIGVLRFLDFLEELFFQVLFLIEQGLHGRRASIVRHAKSLGFIGAGNDADAEDG